MNGVTDTIQTYVSKFILKWGDAGLLYWQIYTVLLILYVTTLTIWIVNSNKETNKIEILFWISVVITTFLIRAPGLSRGYLNPDESEWIASCNTLFQDPIFWFNHTYNTTRFFTVFLLIPFKIISPFFSHSVAQIAVISYTLLIIYLIYISLGYFWDKRLSKILILPIWSTVSLFTLWDYIAYNSEYACNVYISIVLILAVKSLNFEKNLLKKKLMLFSAGTMIGILPHAKDQSLTIAICLIVWFIIVHFRNRYYIWVLLSFIATNLIILTFIITVGEWEALKLNIANRMLNSEQGLVLETAKESRFISSLKNIFSVIDSRPILFIILFFILINISKTKKIFTSKVRNLFLFLILWLLGSWFSVLLSTKFFPHYNIFFFLPFCLLGIILFWLNKDTHTFNKAKMITYLIVGVVVPTLYTLKNGNQALDISKTEDRLLQDPMSEEILKFTGRNQTLAIWGWNNNLYVNTGCSFGTRVPFPFYIENNFPSKEHDLKNYANDIKMRKPKVFIDTYSTWDESMEQHIGGHRKFEGIKKTILDLYIPFRNKHNFDIFVLKEIFEDRI